MRTDCYHLQCTVAEQTINREDMDNFGVSIPDEEGFPVAQWPKSDGNDLCVCQRTVILGS